VPVSPTKTSISPIKKKPPVQLTFSKPTVIIKRDNNIINNPSHIAS